MLLFTQSTENAEKPEKKKKRRFRRPILVALISFLLSLVMLAALVVAIPVTLLRFLLTDHNIEVIVDHLIDTLDVTAIEIPTGDGTKTLSGAVLEFTSDIEGLEFITEEQINEVLLNDFARQIITDTLKQYGLSLKGGNGSFELKPEQIYAFLEENKDTLEALARESGYEGEFELDKYKSDVMTAIESTIGKEGISTDAILGASEETKQIRDILDRAQLVFSDSALWLVWGLVAFVAMLLLFLNIRYLSCFCRACGFPAFIVGGLYMLAVYAVDFLLSIFEIENDMIAELVRFTVGFATALLADITLPVLITGIALLLASFVLEICKMSYTKE